MTRTAKPVMCSVTIGYQCFILSSADGIKLVQLMQNAVGAEQNYDNDGSEKYHVTDQPRVEYRALKPDQILMPETVESAGVQVKRQRRLT